MTRSRTTSTSANASFALSLFLLACFYFQESLGFAMAPAALHPPIQHGFVSVSRTTTLWFRNVAASASQTTKPRQKQPTIRKESVVIRDMESPEELLEFLGNNQQDGDRKPSVVFYYAGWCKRCRKVGLQLQTVARKLGSKHGPVRFASMECKPSTQDFLADTMGVKGLPNLRVYNHDGKLLVDSGSSVRDLAKDLAKILRGGQNNANGNKDRFEKMESASFSTVHEELQLSLGVATL